MKRLVILSLFAIAALVACGEEKTDVELACDRVMECSSGSYSSHDVCVADALGEPWPAIFINCINQTSTCEAIQTCDQ